MFEIECRYWRGTFRIALPTNDETSPMRLWCRNEDELSKGIYERLDRQVYILVEPASEEEARRRQVMIVEWPGDSQKTDLAE